MTEDELVERWFRVLILIFVVGLIIIGIKEGFFKSKQLIHDDPYAITRTNSP